MSQIRAEFYQAINKANTWKPKPVTKKAIVETVSVEEQFERLLNDSDSAIIVEEFEIKNENVVEWLKDLTKKDEATLKKEKRQQELDNEIEAKKELMRKEWRFRNKLYERVFIPSGAAAAAGAGGSGNRVLTPEQISKYIQMGYVEFGYVE